MSRILVATTDGLHVLDGGGHEREVHHLGKAVSFVAEDGGELWAIVDGSQIWRISDGSWRRLAELPELRARCLALTDFGVFVGTSEARLFRVTGDTLEAVGAFDEVDLRAGWYTPWGGPPDTRSMSEWDDDVYVNVHVGGILRSDDGGA